MSSSFNDKVGSEQNATENNIVIGATGGQVSSVDDEKKGEEVQQQPTLCLSNCGFYGNSKTRGLCSSCYNKEVKNELEQQGQQQTQMSTSSKVSTPTLTVTSPNSAERTRGTKRSIYEAAIYQENIGVDASPLSTSPASSSSMSNSSSVLTPTKSFADGVSSPAGISSPSLLHMPSSPITQAPMSPSGAMKCGLESCGKKILSTGVMSESNRCRCGGIYCGKHMHNHDCTFDYKSQAKTEIAKANPQIMANKIVKL